MNAPAEAVNPFGPLAEVKPAETAAARSDQERAIREVEAAMVIAKRFPRDTRVAMDRILQSCTRPTLAENALYAYPRGGQVITGPSIRLAEALAQNWGNIQFGIRELAQTRGESTVEAFAWDIETNTRQTKTFQVRHIRYTRSGVTNLEDPRDIYEMVANQGARRLRACILGVIPGDVTETAVRQCELTMEHATGAPEEEVEKMVAAFAAHGVTREMIAKRLGHHLNATIAAEVIGLRKIFASIRDGMAKAADFFADDAAADLNESIESTQKPKDGKGKARKRTQTPPAPAGDENAAEPAKDAEDAGSAPPGEPATPAEPAQPALDEVASLIKAARDADELAAAEDLANTWQRGTKERQLLLDHLADAKRRLGLEE